MASDYNEQRHTKRVPEVSVDPDPSELRSCFHWTTDLEIFGHV